MIKIGFCDTRNIVRAELRAVKFIEDFLKNTGWGNKSLSWSTFPYYHKPLLQFFEKASPGGTGNA